MTAVEIPSNGSAPYADGITATERPALAKLREKFEDASVGKLPRVTCRKCRDSHSGNCDEHKKERCDGCGNYITKAHIHLSYVGHAEVTDRLLTADPTWDWQPLARDIDPHHLAAAIETGNADIVKAVMESSPPRFERNAKGEPVGLWIKLTVDGVTRLGYGSLDRAKTDAEKELIGDALRNAAMRFGVALNLWSKTELESSADETPADAGAEKLTDPWRALGYMDEAHLHDVNDPLQRMWRALDEERRPAVKAWLKDNGYNAPVPVREEHADAYRRVLEGQEAAPARDLPKATEQQVHELREAIGKVTPVERRNACVEAIRKTFGFDKAEDADPASVRAATRMAGEWANQAAAEPELAPKIAAVVAYAEANGRTRDDCQSLADAIAGNPWPLHTMTDVDAAALESMVGDLIRGDVSITNGSVIAA